MFYLLHELNSLPLLLLSQPLPPLSLLETLAEWVVVVKLHLQVVETEVESEISHLCGPRSFTLYILCIYSNNLTVITSSLPPPVDQWSSVTPLTHTH